jgi:hypothetical protein
VLVCSLAFTGPAASVESAHGDVAAASAKVPIPSAANLTVARLTLQAGPGAAGAPRLIVARAGLPREAFVSATVSKAAAPGRFLATVAVIRPEVEPAAKPGQSTGSVSVLVPGHYRLVGTQVLKDVLYQNAAPGFRLVVGGGASMLAGASPRLPVGQIVRDAQLLALDRSVPLADMGLLRLPFVAVQFGPLGATLRLTIGVTGLSPVNAVEVHFPAGIRVTSATGPQGTTTLPMGAAVQFVTTAGSFQDGVAYEFTVGLSQAPRKGDSAIVRASTHYFESALPLIERFVLGY